MTDTTLRVAAQCSAIAFAVVGYSAAGALVAYVVLAAEGCATKRPVALTRKLLFAGALRVSLADCLAPSCLGMSRVGDRAEGAGASRVLPRAAEDPRPALVSALRCLSLASSLHPWLCDGAQQSMSGADRQVAIHYGLIIGPSRPFAGQLADALRQRSHRHRLDEAQ